MKQFTEYKLTITDPSTNFNRDFVWPVVDRNAWAFCVRTEKGEIWLESKHATFGSEHDKVRLDQLNHYLNWLKFQLQNDINLFVEVSKIDDDASTGSKSTSFKLPFTSHQWCEESNTWIIDKQKTKDIYIPKKLIDESLNGKLLAPFWFVKKLISAGGRETLNVIRKVRQSDISSLFLNATPTHNH